jgi:uncharacterized RDD family membrane protein YckC
MQTNLKLVLEHWGPRLFALIIDSLVVAIPASIIYFVPLNGYVPSWGPYGLFPLILGVLEVIYFSLMESYLGTTIGKRIVGLRVQTTDGSEITLKKALIRNISKIYWLLLLIDWIIAVVTPDDDPHQKYTDRIAGTTVAST